MFSLGGFWPTFLQALASALLKNKMNMKIYHVSKAANTAIKSRYRQVEKLRKKIVTLAAKGEKSQDDKIFA